MDNNNGKHRLSFTIRRLPSYHHIIWKYVFFFFNYTTILLWAPTNSGARISLLSTGIRIWKKNWNIFWGIWLPRTRFCQKRPFNLSLCFKSIFKLELWNIKSQFIKKNWYLWDMLWQDVSFPSFNHQFKTHLFANFHAKFGQKGIWGWAKTSFGFGSFSGKNPPKISFTET